MPASARNMNSCWAAGWMAWGYTAPKSRSCCKAASLPKRSRSRSTRHAAALPEQAGHAAHLDIGADKQLPYMPISEENPCGLARHPYYPGSAGDLLIQVRAMLRANAGTGNLGILLPMVTSLEEVDEAKRLIDRAGREVEKCSATRSRNRRSA